jgi:hypothetical protein
MIRKPLSIPPPDGSTPSSGSRTPNTGREAFDKTMGSGDHDLPAVTATAAPFVSPDAATVASQDGKVLAPDFGTAGTIASSERPSIAVPASSATPTPAGSKKTLVLVGGVLAAAIAAAGIMYVVMRPDPPAIPKTAASDPRPIVETKTPPVDERPPPPPPPPVETKLLGSAGSATETPKKQPKVPKQPVEETDEPAPTGTHSAEKIALALSLLDQKKWEEAGQAATEAKGDEHATSRERATAFMVLGIVGCRKNNQEAGMNQLRALEEKFPKLTKLRKRLVADCKTAGYPLE